MAWVKLKECNNRVEAEVAKSYIESSGITVRLQTDDLGGLQPQLDFTRGITLFVDEADFPEAARLLTLIVPE